MQLCVRSCYSLPFIVTTSIYTHVRMQALNLCTIYGRLIAVCQYEFHANLLVVVIVANLV